MKSFESTGRFWLPETPESALWGKLRFEPGAGTSVVLDGNIHGSWYAGRNFSITELHGQLFNGAPCVLADAWGVVETFITTAEHFRTRIYGRHLLFGVRPDEGGSVPLYWSSVKFSHLDEWFDRPLSLRYRRRNFDKALVTFSPDSTRASLNYKGIGFSLETFCGRTIPSLLDAEGLSFTYDYQLIIKPEPAQPFTWHLEVANVVRSLFTFLIGSGVYTLQLQAGTQPPATNGPEVHLFSPVRIPAVVRLDTNYFYSQHQDVRDAFPDLAQQWFERHQDLAVVRDALVELLTLDGMSPESVFVRVVQTLEHFHGLALGDQSQFVPTALWRRFIDGLRQSFVSCVPDAAPAEQAVLSSARDTIVNRVGGLNSLPLRGRLRQLFLSVPPTHLMPLINNPRDAEEYIDTFLRRIEATRNFLTHFSVRQRDLVLNRKELESATLQCWAVLIYCLAQWLGLADSLSSQLAYSARTTLFLISRDSKL